MTEKIKQTDGYVIVKKIIIYTEEFTAKKILKMSTKKFKNYLKLLLYCFYTCRYKISTTSFL